MATRLFQEKGYHATGMDDIGAAAGITGPAIYRHFKNKEEILETMLTERSAEVLARARQIVDDAAEPREALEGLVDLYVEMAFENPALAFVALYERRTIRGDLRATIERAERLYFEEWVHALVQVRPELSDTEARVMVHAVTGLGLMAGTYRSGLDRSVLQPLTRNMMLNALSVEQPARSRRAARAAAG